MSEQYNFPTAQSNDYLIPANSAIPVAIQGDSVRCIESTGTFFVQFNSSGSGVEFSKGLAYEAPDGLTFENLTLVNRTGLPITAKLFIGFGKVADSRFSLTGGVVEVKNETFGALRIKPTIDVVEQLIVTVNDVVGGVSLGVGSAGQMLYNNGNSVAWLRANGNPVAGQCIPLFPGQHFDNFYISPTKAICAAGETTDIVVWRKNNAVF